MFQPNRPNMRFTQTIFTVAALSALGFAQNGGVCDPQNDNGVTCVNGTPVSSNGVAISTSSATNNNDNDNDNNDNDNDNDSTSTGGSRLSVITSTNTNVLVSTTRNVVLDTTSLPHSLDTRTSTYLNTVVQTLDSAYTTNTLNTNTVTATTRVGGAAATTTASTNTVTTGTAASSSSTGAAAAAMQTAGNFASFGVAVAALGFAAAL